MADDMVELLGRRTGPHLHDTLGDLADEVRATRRLSDADELRHRHVESSMREAEQTGHEPSEPPRGGTSAPSRADFLSNFPEYPVDRVFSGPGDIAHSYSLDHRGTETVIGAYEIARKYIAPFNTWISDSILRDLRLEALADPRRKFAFLGRDGHIIAAGVRGRDPEFFRERCVELVVSRPVMELVARDYERITGIKLPLASDFRVNLEARPNPDLWHERIPGSFDNFISYINRKGLGDGPITVVDNSLRGSAQEIMTHVLGKEINGHYAFLSVSPSDLNPGTKKGHVFHLPASEWQGGNARTLPDDPKLTFLHTRSLWVVESLVPGPAQSAVAIGRNGPVQMLPDLVPSRTRFPGPIDGTYREPGVERYWEPGVEEASRASILLAASHHAQGGGPGNLDNFTDQLRKWLQRDEGRDPDLARLTSALSLYGAH